MSNPQTMREALIAEVLQDMEALVGRFEQADATLAERIKTSTKDATGAAFLEAKLSFKSFINESSDQLRAAGQEGSEQIARRLDQSIARAVVVHQALERKERWLVLLLAFFSLVGGATGGLVMGYLLKM